MRVVTIGAVYEFDPRSMTGVRLRHQGADMRRDGQPFALLSWPEPVLGYRMQVQLRPQADGQLPQIHETTPVVRIERTPRPRIRQTPPRIVSRKAVADGD